MTLKAARVINGLTQREMAKKLGVHVQTYRKWEKNPEIVEVGVAKKISNILGISYDNIFFNNDSTLSR